MVLEQLGGAPARVALKPGGANIVRWHTAPLGLDLILRPAGRGTLAVAYAATQERWPAEAPALPERPQDVMGFDTSDSTLITGTRRFAW
jgi:hypothetical protein